jgi:hypothetical protein
MAFSRAVAARRDKGHGPYRRAETIVSVERPRTVEAGSIRLAMDAARKRSPRYKPSNLELPALRLDSAASMHRAIVGPS